MKTEDLIDAIGAVDGNLISEADRPMQNRSKKNIKKYIGIAASVILLISGGVLLHELMPGKLPGNTGNGEETAGDPGSALGIDEYLRLTARAAAAYPEMKKIPVPEDFTYANGSVDYAAYSDALNRYYEEQPFDFKRVKIPDFIAEFYRKTEKAALSGEHNSVVSPVNIAMVLGLLTECTDGNSRRQILDALGGGSVEEIEEYCAAVWDSLYCDDGTTFCDLANSLWINEQYLFRDELFSHLAETFRASTYGGTPGDEAFDSLLRTWMNKHTGDLLNDSVEGIRMDPSMILSLVSTVSYSSRWSAEFDPAKNESGVFHAAAGDETAEFMHERASGCAYAELDDCTVYRRQLNKGYMTFVLPNEGKTLEDVIASGHYDTLAFRGSDGWFAGYLNFAVPKFDVAQSGELNDFLLSLGIADVFDPNIADFSPVSHNGTKDGIFLSSAQHSARVKIDEHGVVGAAYARVEMCGAGLPDEEEKYMILDRPFLFRLTDDNGTPIFTGTVCSVS